MANHVTKATRCYFLLKVVAVVVTIEFLWSYTTIAKTVTTKCEGPTSASPDGNNAVTITTDCIECGTGETNIKSGSICSDGKMFQYCCTDSYTDWTGCFLDPPPGMHCEQTANKNGIEHAVFVSSPPPEPVCIGPTTPDPSGFGITFTESSGKKSDYYSDCNVQKNAMVGFCCENSIPGGPLDSKKLCEYQCPNGFTCQSGSKLCVPGDSPKCSGQTQPNPDGIFSVTLTWSNPPKTMTVDSNSPGQSGSCFNIGDKDYLGQYCCKHDLVTNQDYIGFCYDSCDELVPDSCCINGKCIKKAHPTKPRVKESTAKTPKTPGQIVVPGGTPLKTSPLRTPSGSGGPTVPTITK